MDILKLFDREIRYNVHGKKFLTEYASLLLWFDLDRDRLVARVKAEAKIKDLFHDLQTLEKQHGDAKSLLLEILLLAGTGDELLKDLKAMGYQHAWSYAYMFDDCVRQGRFEKPLHWKPVSSLEDIDEALDILAEFWPENICRNLRERFCSELDQADRHPRFLALIDGKAAACAWTTYNPDSGLAGLWGGTTRQAYQGRGLYRSLVSLRCRLAAERGHHYAYSYSGPESLPILKRLGFQSLGTWQGLERQFTTQA